MEIKYEEILSIDESPIINLHSFDCKVLETILIENQKGANFILNGTLINADKRRFLLFISANQRSSVSKSLRSFQIRSV